MRLYRRALWLMVAFASAMSPAAATFAQDGANLDDMKKMYQDALGQLKAAQDRKSELANENAKLTSRVADLEKQVEVFKRQSADQAEQTFFIRSRYAAWQLFIKQYPDMLERWKFWLTNSGIKTGTMPAMGDEADWPFGE